MESSSFSPSTILSDSETISDTDFTSGTTKKTNQKTISTRSNRSFTSFFFRIDDEDSNFTYCKVCEKNLEGTNKTAYRYSRKGGNTSNLILHLREKHKITKKNYTNFLDEQEEVIFFISYYC